MKVLLLLVLFFSMNIHSQTVTEKVVKEVIKTVKKTSEKVKAQKNMQTCTVEMSMAGVIGLSNLQRLKSAFSHSKAKKCNSILVLLSQHLLVVT